MIFQSERGFRHQRMSHPNQQKLDTRFSNKVYKRKYKNRVFVPFKGTSDYNDNYCHQIDKQIQKKAEKWDQWGGGRGDSRRVLVPTVAVDIGRRRGKDHTYSYKNFDGRAGVNGIINTKYNQIEGFEISNKIARRGHSAGAKGSRPFLNSATYESTALIQCGKHDGYNPINNKYKRTKVSRHTPKDHDLFGEGWKSDQKADQKKKREANYTERRSADISRRKKDRFAKYSTPRKTGDKKKAEGGEGRKGSTAAAKASGQRQSLKRGGSKQQKSDFSKKDKNCLYDYKMSRQLDIPRVSRPKDRLPRTESEHRSKKLHQKFQKSTQKNIDSLQKDLRGYRSYFDFNRRKSGMRNSATPAAAMIRARRSSEANSRQKRRPKQRVAAVA